MQYISILQWGTVISVLTICFSNLTLAQEVIPSIPNNQWQEYIDENGDGFNDSTHVLYSIDIFNVYSRERDRIEHQLGRTEAGVRVRFLNERHFRLKGDTQDYGGIRGRSFRMNE